MKRSSHWLRKTSADLMLGLLACCLPSAASAGEYRLRSGDTVEIIVVGAPDLKQRLTIDIDGQIGISLVGSLQVSGMTISNLTEKLQQVLPAKAYRIRGSDLKTGQRAAEDGEIVVNIAEFSPVYVNGDVAKPGEVHFRPNLTVRKAVALAGGYEVMRERFVDPVILSADLGAEYQSLWIEQARRQTRLARLEAQLAERQSFHVAAPESPVSRELLHDLARTEQQQFTLRKSNLLKDSDFLTRAITSASDQLTALAEQRDKEKEGVLSDTAELERLQQANRMGNVTMGRLVEQRRSMLFSSTRLLQTQAQITQLTREREDYSRRMERLDEVTKLELLSELQETKVTLAALNAKIAATARKMDYAGSMRSELAVRTKGKRSVLIVRQTAGSTLQIAAEEDTILEPGDVVEISLTSIGSSDSARNATATAE